MYISRLLVRHFRNFERFDVPLRPGANCIVGENNTGKTNLVHAIRLPLDANLSSVYRQLTSDDFPAGTDIRTPQQILISLEFRDYADKPSEEAMVNDWSVGDACVTTLERAITYRGTLQMLSLAAKECGAPKASKRLDAIFTQTDWTEAGSDDTKAAVEEARKLVLNTAKRIGKARFAQVASRHIALATGIPKYLREAVEWLTAK